MIDGVFLECISFRFVSFWSGPSFSSSSFLATFWFWALLLLYCSHMDHYYISYRTLYGSFRPWMLHLPSSRTVNLRLVLLSKNKLILRLLQYDHNIYPFHNIHPIGFKICKNLYGDVYDGKIESISISLSNDGDGEERVLYNIKYCDGDTVQIDRYDEDIHRDDRDTRCESAVVWKSTEGYVWWPQVIPFYKIIILHIWLLLHYLVYII